LLPELRGAKEGAVVRRILPKGYLTVSD
jgi:hypothetical protein